MTTTPAPATPPAPPPRPASDITPGDRRTAILGATPFPKPNPERT